MSKYTTELRFICEQYSGLGSSVGYADTKEVIEKALPKIFDFSFPIYNENYRKELETKIIYHFYTREICEETVGLWKLRLNRKLNEIMPYYNKLYNSESITFDPLNTIDVTTTKEGIVGNTNTDNRTLESSITGNNVSEYEDTRNNKTTDKYSDTPQGGLTNLEEGTYLTNARQDTLEDNVTGESKNSVQTDTATKENKQGTSNTTESYSERKQGYESSNISEKLLNYRKTFLNIDLMIIDDLEELFIQLW